MALVEYDFDSSENEDEENEETHKSSISNLNVEVKTNSSKNDLEVQKDVTVSERNNLFSNLPQTKAGIEKIKEDEIEDFIPKSQVKEKQKVKISIPALSQFTDVLDDEPETKKLKLSNKSSGLMSILPPVKGSVTTTKSFVPKSVTIKNQNNSTTSNVKSTSTLVPNVIRKQAESKKNLLKKVDKKQLKKSESDSESDDDIDMPETFDDAMWEKVCGRPVKQTVKITEEPLPERIVNIAPEPEKPYEGLDNQAFKELVGKNKRPIGNIKLIDINEEEILPEKDLWMTKSLTDPEMAPKPQIEDPVDPTRRKKHHITYLAQQAKANEQELQNAWSSSKNNRLATRAKYGF